MALLTVDNLKTYFHTRNGVVRAVDGISYEINKGETLGIVGESGSGKSVSCYSLLGLIPTPPGRIESGHAYFGQEGAGAKTDLLHADKATLRKIRGKRVSMIFQDPMTCLNPYMRVGAQVMEPLLVHEGVSESVAKKRAIEALADVGILDPESRFNQYPHQFSGGMRQRVMIAMALITKPELLIADEPTTALDVTIQAQILELIKKLQKDTGTAVIFITHDLGVIASLADRILVMYAGRVAEEGRARDVFYKPSHPYTRALLQSIPGLHAKGEKLYTIPGMPPDLSKAFRGCSFAPRCEHKIPRCTEAFPEFFTLEGAHRATCYRATEMAARPVERHVETHI